jgi:hypothetical protein
MVFSIISVTIDAILAAARNHQEKIGSHGQKSVEKIIGSAEKNRVGREPQVFFSPSACQGGGRSLTSYFLCGRGEDIFQNDVIHWQHNTCISTVGKQNLCLFCKIQYLLLGRSRQDPQFCCRGNFWQEKIHF